MSRALSLLPPPHSSSLVLCLYCLQKLVMICLAFAGIRADASLLFGEGFLAEAQSKKVLLSDPNAVRSGVAGENLQGKLSTVTDCLCNHLKVVENCFELTRV